MNSYLRLAKEAVETHVKTGHTISPLADLPPEMLTEKAGVFVSIHQKLSPGHPPTKSVGPLRGCVGTFLPTRNNLAQEIIASAVSAAHDPRFPNLNQKELPNLVYSVDVLSTPKAATKKDLKPKKYGLLVIAADGRRGLLLPDLPGVETAEQQITICKRKARIAPEEKVQLRTFTAQRHHE